MRVVREKTRRSVFHSSSRCRDAPSGFRRRRHSLSLDVLDAVPKLLDRRPDEGVNTRHDSEVPRLGHGTSHHGRHAVLPARERSRASPARGSRVHLGHASHDTTKDSPLRRSTKCGHGHLDVGWLLLHPRLKRRSDGLLLVLDPKDGVPTLALRRRLRRHTSSLRLDPFPDKRKAKLLASADLPTLGLLLFYPQFEE